MTYHRHPQGRTFLMSRKYQDRQELSRRPDALDARLLAQGAEVAADVGGVQRPTLVVNTRPVSCH